jgi:hypothetical protein
MNRNILKTIKGGMPFKFDVPVTMSIKRSPMELDCLKCEHQYNETYIFRCETEDNLHFALCRNNNNIDCKWRIEKHTNNLYVYIKNSSTGWEQYCPGEYVIKVLK